MKIIFHCGAHKTASSHLQYNLKLNRKLLERKGIVYFKFKEIDGLGRAAIRLRQKIFKGSSDINKTITFIRDTITKTIRGYDYAIISYEGVFGSMAHSDQTDLYQDAEKLIEIYKQILDDHQVIPVYAIRDYDGFLRSSYKWMLKKEKLAMPLNKYLADSHYSENRWTQIIESIRNNFGKIEIYTLEDYKNTPKEILFRMINQCKDDVNFNELTFSQKEKNTSDNKKGLDFYYTINLLFRPLIKSNIEEKFRQNIKRKFRATFSSGTVSKILLNHRKQNIPRVDDLNKYLIESEKLTEKYGILILF